MIPKRTQTNLQDKTQSVKQAPLITEKGIPARAQMANMNPNSWLLDETNGVLHIKGATKTWKFQGVPE